MEELVRVFAGRPAFVKKDGWLVSVSTMDAAYQATWRAYKRLLRDNHPDKGGSAGKFRKLMGQRERWLEEEERRYEALGLEPPDYNNKKKENKNDFEGTIPALD